MQVSKLKKVFQVNLPYKKLQKAFGIDLNFLAFEIKQTYYKLKMLHFHPFLKTAEIENIQQVLDFFF